MPPTAAVLRALLQVGFRVGGPEERGIQYLVLQVHYASTANINATTGDTSGVVLNYTAAP